MILNKEMAESVAESGRVSNGLIWMHIEVNIEIINVLSAYAPRQDVMKKKIRNSGKRWMK